MANAESGKYALLDELAEDFAVRYRRGERPTLKDYIDRHPELADDIRALLPAMVEIEQVKGDIRDPVGPVSAPAVPGLTHLGEYHILREIGRGGMGVVYEAEQLSLGRRVAVKLLRGQTLRDPNQKQRFEREAKAAAKLHHTNIVPVFGVGEHQGQPYYVMQFIQGLGLDQVIEELRNAQSGGTGSGTGAGERPIGPKDATAAELARSMLTGVFTRAFADDDDADRELPVQVDRPACTAATPQVPAAATPSSGELAEALTTSSSSVLLPGHRRTGRKARIGKQTYWQSVARVGIEVASALDYAHKQGILHRDVKPSNLLLDSQGTVWVTDFGLAKIEDQENLTHTGDILGTLRYMPPEAFDGQADPRNDVYSLGLTLYEMLALRPAFDERDRHRLIKQVTHSEPPRLERINRSIPRDLATIVHKASEGEPGRRYATAAELNADLQRFLDDEPIRARRAGLRERAWRWCRRNRAVAGLTAGLAVLLIVIAAGSLFAAWQLHERETDALVNWEQAENARKEEAQQRLIAQQAQRTAEKHRDSAMAETYRAVLSETRALRLSHKSGWRRDALTNVSRLARLDTTQRDLTEIRHEAIACLAELDAREVARFLGHARAVISLRFSPDGATLATASYDGIIHCWEVREQRYLRSIVDSAYDPRRAHAEDAPSPNVQFHPDGKSVAFSTWKNRIDWLAWAGRDKTPPPIKHAGHCRALSLDAKGTLTAVAWNDGSVGVYETATGKQKWTGQAQNAFHMPAHLSPSGALLACAGSDHRVLLHHVAEKKEPVVLGRHREQVLALCFSHDGSLLVSGSADKTVKAFDVASGTERLSLHGHTARIMGVAISPDGQVIASASDDRSVRLWDVLTGELLLVLHPEPFHAYSVAFSPDGTLLAVGCVNSFDGTGPVVLYQLSNRQARHKLLAHTYGIRGLAFHPRRPILASASFNNQLLIWDSQTNRLLRSLKPEATSGLGDLAFSPDGTLLAAAPRFPSGGVRNPHALQIWEDYESATPRLRRELAGHGNEVGSLTFDPTGKFLASGSRNGSAIIWDVDSGKAVHRWTGLTAWVMVNYVNQGKHLLLADGAGRIVVRDVAGGALVGETKVPRGVVQLALAPDGKHIALGCLDGVIRVLSLPDLGLHASLDRVHQGAIYGLAFTPDGKLLASGDERGTAALWDARTLRKLLTFPRLASVVHQLCFDPDGLRLALCGDELITVWNLSIIRPQLATLGLDWDAHGPANPTRAAHAVSGGPYRAESPASPDVIVAKAKTVRAPPREALGKSSAEALAEALHRQRRWQELLPVAEKAIQKTPKAKQLYLYVADAQANLGRFDKAVLAARAHLDLCPNCLTMLDKLASYHAALGQAKQAIVTYERSLNIDPNRAETSNNLAWMLVTGPKEYRDASRALPLAKRAVDLSNGNALYLNTLGVIYYRLGRYQEAVDSLERSLKDSKESTAAFDLFFLAMCHHRLGDSTKAKESYDRAATWLQKQHGKLSRAWTAELTEFQTEAKTVLAQPPGMPRSAR